MASAISQKFREIEVLQPAVIVVLIGLPAAGKSTFTKLLSDLIATSSYDDYKVVKVIYDELIPIELQKKYAENPY